MFKTLGEVIARKLEAEEEEREEALAEIAEAREYALREQYNEEFAARLAEADYEGFDVFAG